MSVGPSVPIVDVAGLLDDHPGERARVGRLVGRACEQVGFLAVSGHGIDTDLVDEALDLTRRLFELPEAEKRAHAWDDGHANRGYDPVGAQRLDPTAEADHKEAWSFGPEHLVGGASPMHGPNRWPPLPGFREVVERYHRETMALAERLLRGVALSLGLDEGHFEPYHRAPVCTLRLMHYPPRHPSAGWRSFGAGPHTDWGALTVLAQDDAGSLEAATASGGWVEVPSVPGTFVVNVGDLLARWTNDRLRSTPHRVRGVSGRHRYSIATFFDLDHDARIEVLPTCLAPGEEPRYPPTTAGEHLMERYRASLR